MSDFLALYRHRIANIRQVARFVFGYVFGLQDVFRRQIFGVENMDAGGWPSLFHSGLENVEREVKRLQEMIYEEAPPCSALPISRIVEIHVPTVEEIFQYSHIVTFALQHLINCAAEERTQPQWKELYDRLEFPTTETILRIERQLKQELASLEDILPGLVQEAKPKPADEKDEEEVEWSHPDYPKSWARRFGISRNTMSKWFREKKVRAQQVNLPNGKLWRIDNAELEALKKRNRT